MAAQGDLKGCVVLVVEDEFYIAEDTAEALRHAGAVVLGPCPSQRAAFHMLAEFRPTHAIVDLNLDGDGPKFDIVRMLKDQAVHTLIMSGYNAAVIPPDLGETPCMQKPVAYGKMVASLRARAGDAPHIIAKRPPATA